MAHIDFIIAPQPGLVCALGWAAVDDARAPVLRTCGGERAPLWSGSHPREDMDPATARGRLWVFDVGEAPLEGAVLEHAGCRRKIGSEQLAGEGDRFVAQAVDGAFYGTLWAMAVGRVPGVAADWGALLSGRLAGRHFPCLEAESVALGIDRADHATALGIGLLQGWSLGAGPLPELAALLVGAGAPPRRLPVSQGVLETSALGDFAGRYAVTGADGFAVALVGDLVPAAQVLVLIRDCEGRVQGLTTQVAARTPMAMADVVMAAEERARRLGCTILPALTEPVEAAAPLLLPDAPGGGDRVVVLLDHDAPPLALRDAVRALVAALGAPFRLHLAQPPCARAQAALRGALAEAPPGAVRPGAPVGPASLEWTVEDADWVIFARSSALFQLQSWHKLLPRALAAEGTMAAAAVFAPEERWRAAAREAVAAAVRGGETGLVAVVSAAALRAAACRRRRASLDGEIRARLMRLREGGAAVRLEADPAGVMVPGIDPLTGGARNGAGRFDLALMAAGAR